MKPLINLKSFLTILLVLILSCSVLVAYFRNNVPGAGGHEHGGMETDGNGHAAAEPKPRSGQPHAETSPPATQSRKEDDHTSAHEHQPLTSDAEPQHH